MKASLSAALLLSLTPAVFASGAPEVEPDAMETEAKRDLPAPDLSLLPFTPETVQKVVVYHQPKIQSCYEETLAARAKPIEGKLMTRFVITPEGMVKGAKVQKKRTTPMLRDRKLNDCVVAALTSMTFPKPPSGKPQTVDYPFNLKPVQ